MDWYRLIRPLLFSLEPETAHHLTFSALRIAHQCRFDRLFAPPPMRSPRQVMGIDFPNPIGLAAGLDKDGALIDPLATWGFGFIEIGTVTPRPQPGNPKPRMFRLPAAQALINRMGFNNHGVDAAVERIARSRFHQSGGVLGINIGKNADTPIDRAADDYRLCLARVYRYASYIAINISSPNTKNLRSLQDASALDALLAALMSDRQRLADQHQRLVPLALKIAPDLNDEQIQAIADLLRRHRLDAVIATNTTLSRDAVNTLAHAEESGGLSGAPVFNASNEVIARLHTALQGELPIIGVGGLLSGADAVAKINAGASLLQVYTGLIYRGPKLIEECVAALDQGN